jgi:hypothetical protein
VQLLLFSFEELLLPDAAGARRGHCFRGTYRDFLENDGGAGGNAVALVAWEESKSRPDPG